MSVWQPCRHPWWDMSNMPIMGSSCLSTYYDAFAMGESCVRARALQDHSMRFEEQAGSPVPEKPDNASENQIRNSKTVMFSKK